MELMKRSSMNFQLRKPIS